MAHGLKRLACCALLLTVVCNTVAASELVATREDGTEIARLPVPVGTGWCVLWNHSVKGFPVSDCYENQSGRMVLVSSRQPDFAAGLGHLPGRGKMLSDGQGGYWIRDINEPVPGNAYILRPGLGAVNHRLQVGTSTVSLSEAAARQRVRIELMD